MFCPKCGNELPDTAAFCNACGATIEKKVPAAADAANSAASVGVGAGAKNLGASLNPKLIGVVAAIVVIVIVLVVGVRGCSGGSDPSTGDPRMSTETPTSGDIYENLTEHYWKDDSKDANIIFFEDGTYALRIDDGTYGKYQGKWEKQDGGITLVQTLATEETGNGKVHTDKSEHRYSITISGTGKDRVLTCTNLGLTLRW